MCIARNAGSILYARLKMWYAYVYIYIYIYRLKIDSIDFIVVTCDKDHPRRLS